MEKLANAGSGLSKLKETLATHAGPWIINAVFDRDGVIKGGQQDLCEVFASFYKDLCKESEQTGTITYRDGCRDAKITAEEVRSALKRFKRRRTGAEDGLVAVMLKTGHNGLVKAIARLFSDICQCSLPPPEEWKFTKLVIILKKYDARMLGNYKPISIIPVMMNFWNKHRRNVGRAVRLQKRTWVFRRSAHHEDDCGKIL